MSHSSVKTDSLFGDGTPSARYFPRFPGYGLGSKLVETFELPDIAYIRVTWVGEENMYFLLPCGRRAYCKLP